MKRAGRCRGRWLLLLLIVSALGLWGTAVEAQGPGWRGGDSSGTLALEGKVLKVARGVAEAGVEVVQVVLKAKSGEFQLALGPPAVLEALGFSVQEGDRLRVRAFEGAPGAVLLVQKVMNLEKGSILRLRTMNKDPLWDAAGSWQGGAGRGGPPRDRGLGPDGKRGPHGR